MPRTWVSTVGRVASRNRSGKGNDRHPLTVGLLGQHMLDEVGGGLGHASRATAWAEAAALATERHQLLMPAGIAFDAQESVFEAPALQVRLELFDDEVGE